ATRGHVGGRDRLKNSAMAATHRTLALFKFPVLQPVRSLSTPRHSSNAKARAADELFNVTSMYFTQAGCSNSVLSPVRSPPTVASGHEILVDREPVRSDLGQCPFWAFFCDILIGQAGRD